MARSLVVGVLWALFPVIASSAELDGRARISSGAGLDTNARRDATQENLQPVTDALVSLMVSGEGRVRFENAQLLGNYDGGGRKFLLYPSEDVLVQSANAEGSVAVGQYLGVGLQGRARDRRGGDRDYTDLGASAFLDFVPDQALDLRVYGGAHRFIYWPGFRYSFRAAEVGGTGRYRFNRQHSALLFGELGLRTYNGLAERSPEDQTERPPVRREDAVFSVGAGYAYRGPLALSFTYAYSDQSSNSFGETTRKHRLNATAAFRLPWKLFLFVQGALQLSSYPEGFRLSPDLIVEEEAENHNSLTVKVVRPLSESFDAELRLAAYRNRLPSFNYDRQLAWGGITWRY